MRTYETMLVLDPEMSKEQVEGFIERLKQFITDRGAEVLKIKEWGINTLAYTIKRRKKGNYILLYMNGSSALVAEMEKNLRLMEEVLRYLTVRQEEGDIDASRQTVEREGETAAEAMPQEKADTAGAGQVTEVAQEEA
ncbi:MAG: 30S ribosomal protein S6 [Deltaproteobacteria bacterium RBG_16_54_18]|nr:MAG: 30S ribosomal protein S6 [Deltaproteobacteria bacterium RBG_16_54_18]